MTSNLPEPMLLTCDEDMLFSAFSSILTNCVRYAGRRITITATRQQSPATLTIRVSNDGQLLSEQDMAHLFERFYKGADGQTGIGMALSRAYIRLHDGRISAFVQNWKQFFRSSFRTVRSPIDIRPLHVYNPI